MTTGRQASSWAFWGDFGQTRPWAGGEGGEGRRGEEKRKGRGWGEMGLGRARGRTGGRASYKSKYLGKCDRGDEDPRRRLEEGGHR